MFGHRGINVPDLDKARSYSDEAVCHHDRD
jgi:hypothetical protein